MPTTTTGVPPCVTGVCDDERPCPEGQLCVNNMCFDPCDGVECPPGVECENGICPTPPCDEDGLCPEPYDPVILPDGSCFCSPGPSCSTCDTTDDCADPLMPENKWECRDGCCSLKDCTVDGDCPDGQECVGGTCVPSCDGVTCPEGEECHYGVCTRTCDDDCDCESTDCCQEVLLPDGTGTADFVCGPCVPVSGSATASVTSGACAGVVGNYPLTPSYDALGGITGWSYTGAASIGTVTISIAASGVVTLVYNAGPGSADSTATMTIDCFRPNMPAGNATGNLAGGDSCTGSAVTVTMT